MKMKTSFFTVLLVTMLTGILVITACDPSLNAIVPTDRTSQLKIYLTDAPGDYEEVNIDIKEVVVKMKDSADFYSLQTNVGIYDLLQFQDGMDTLLVNDSLPAGTLQEIRLILGPDNSVVIDSVAYDLDTPSAQQSGLKIKTNRVLISGALDSLTIDFDAGQSIVERGTGTFGLKPVIRVLE